MLLLDENLPSRATSILAREFPGAKHVRDFALLESPDTDIWEVAKQSALTIVSKDDDFLFRALLFGHPPKVVLLKVGNCSTQFLIQFLRQRSSVIQSFVHTSSESLLILNR